MQLIPATATHRSISPLTSAGWGGSGASHRWLLSAIMGSSLQREDAMKRQSQKGFEVMLHARQGVPHRWLVSAIKGPLLWAGQGQQRLCERQMTSSCPSRCAVAANWMAVHRQVSRARAAAAPRSTGCCSGGKQALTDRTRCPGPLRGTLTDREWQGRGSGEGRTGWESKQCVVQRKMQREMPCICMDCG